MVEVTVEGVKKRYGEIVALDGVDLTVKDGEYICIIGPSGSGKTTLLKIIAGILKPDEGRVLFDGEDVTDLPVIERRIGLLSQDILLFPHMNVWENIVYSLKAKGYDLEFVENTGREVVGLLNLKYDFRLSPESLSRGSQQKVAIARAIASNPRILLLDEPLGGLDARAAVELKFELRRLAKDLGLTTVHITHNQEEALSVADRIVVMRRGRVEQVGTPLELYFKPKTPFVARFVGGDANFLEARVIDVDYGAVRLEMERLGVTVVAEGDESRFHVGERVLVAVKPEHVMLGEGEVEGVVVEKNFLGPYSRIVVDIDGLEISVRVKRGMDRFNLGDRVRVRLSLIHVYPYPEGGVEKAIAYE